VNISPGLQLTNTHDVE